MIIGLVVVAAVVTMRPGDRGEAPPSPHRGSFFAADSVWNTRVPADAELDATSDVVVAELARQASAGATINVGSYSTPVYTVPADQPTVTVRDIDDGFLNESGEYSWGPVPLPADATGAKGDDRHLVVWQPSTDTMWEFWDLQITADGPTARHGARIPHVSTSPGTLPAPYGATATGLPVIAGTVLAEDVARGRIDHALALAIPEPRREWLTAPATRTDGWSTRPETPIEGSHFRLDPSVDVDSLDLHPFVAMLAHAAQDYGLILRDKAGGVALFGEDPKGLDANPFDAALQGADPSALMRSFPWDRLQLLKTDPVCCWSR